MLKIIKWNHEQLLLQTIENLSETSSKCVDKNTLWDCQFLISGNIFLQENIPLIERSRSLLSSSTKIINQLQKLLKLQLNKVSKTEIRLMAG